MMGLWALGFQVEGLQVYDQWILGVLFSKLPLKGVHILICFDLLKSHAGLSISCLAPRHLGVSRQSGFFLGVRRCLS